MKAVWQRLRHSISTAGGFWAGLVFFVLVVVGLTLSARQLADRLMDANQMPLEQLRLAGERHYSRDGEVQQALAGLARDESFFSLDVDRVQHLVETVPWVRRVSVRRDWPNGLQLYLVEHQPVALWNEALLLNRQGEIFKAPRDRLMAPLPQFYGPAGSGEQVLAAYRALNAQLAAQGFELRELSLSERHSWQITLASGVRLVVGRADAVTRSKRVGHFIRLYPMLMKEDRTLDYVDLRYDTGFAVNWKDSQEHRQ